MRKAGSDEHWYSEAINRNNQYESCGDAHPGQDGGALISEKSSVARCGRASPDLLAVA
jgi:hypothetical protein